jgi:hypothetical protein
MVMGEQVFQSTGTPYKVTYYKGIIKKHASSRIYCCRKEDNISTIPQPRQSSNTNIQNIPGQLHVNRQEAAPGGGTLRQPAEYPSMLELIRYLW